MIRKILNYILKNKLKALTEKDLINWAKSDEEKQKMYISQASTIAKMQLYQDIMKHLKVVSQERMFAKSKSWEDMYFGKAMLYNVDLIEQFIETLRKKNLNK
jgi:phage pi2 protein 07